jgi:5'-nucleotidase
MRVAGIVLLLLALLAAGPTLAQGPITLTILYTSEHHGALLPFDVGEVKNVGGVAARATLVERVRREAPHVLLLDSGDILIGTAMSSVFRGEPDILAMNLMGYDAMAAGNHEFDFGLEHFRRLQVLARFPIISTTVRGVGGEVAPVVVVKRVAGLRIALTSAIDPLTFPDSIHPNVVSQLVYFDAVDTIRTLVDRLAPAADLFIALTHQHTEQDLALARAVPKLAAIVGGHTEGFDGLLTAAGGAPVAALDKPPTVFVKTHRLGATVGRLDLLITGRRVMRATARNLPVRDLPPHPAVAALVKRYQDQLQARFGEVVGRAEVELDGSRANVRTRETNLGNLVADVMREFARTDVALMNGGGIRDSLRAGPITLGDIFRVLAFDNTIVTMRVTGAQLRSALENGVSQVEQGSGRFPQVSGMAFVFDPRRPVGQRVLEVRVGPAPLDPTRTYTLATNDFVAGGGDGYTMLRGAPEWRDSQVLLRDVFIEFVRRVGTVTARVEGRIRTP